MNLQYSRHLITLEDKAAVMAVLESDYLTQGPKVREFEEAFAAKCGAKYCVAVSSGTAALHLAYLAVGVGPGKVFVTSPISFVATANAALYCGAFVDFSDVEPHTGLMEYVGGNADFVCTVALGGCGVHTTMPVEAVVIDDLCHGKMELSSEAVAGCFSFHPCKHIAAGEGGAVVTNDPSLASHVRLMREHGRTEAKMIDWGTNYRLNEMSAALALSQLSRLDWNIQRRRELAARYDEAFEGIETVPHSEHSARHLYQLLVEDRDNVQTQLKAKGITTAIHYPVIPLQPYWADRFGYKPGDFPNAERFAARTLSLPLYPTLTEQEQDYVIQSVLEVL